MTLQEAMAHAGPIDLYGSIEDRARDALPMYIWTVPDPDKPGKKWGVCSWCHEGATVDKEQIPSWVAGDPYRDDDDPDCDLHHPEHADGLRGPYIRRRWKHTDDALDWSGRHGHYGTCPFCGHLVQYRSLNYSRTRMVDECLLIQYRKSALDPRALVMLGVHAMARWDLWDDYNDLEPLIDLQLCEVCVFIPGRPGERFTLDVWYTGDYDSQSMTASNVQRHEALKHRRECKGGFDPHGALGNTFFYRDQWAMDEALKGTPFEVPYKAIKEHDLLMNYLDDINLMAALSKYPAYEYLCKLGLTGIAVDAFNRQDEGEINLRGKTAQKVLKADGNLWGWIKGHREDASLQFLRCVRLAKEHGERIGYDDLAQIASKWDAHWLRKLLDRLPRGELKRALRYMTRRRIIINDYIDYLGQLDSLDMDLRDQGHLYPPDFARMHRELGERIKSTGDRKKDARIAKLLESYGEYWFSALGLTLRPMSTSAEIIREGTLMHHCVGGYVDSYCNGGTILCALREDEALDKPWRTVEFSAHDGRLIQCRGPHNKSPEDEQERIDDFWRLFEQYRRARRERDNPKTRKRLRVA